MKREVNLREGGIIPAMLLFAFPIILGNIFQQVYNLADTLIVGRFPGPGALAAVGSAYSLMTFLNSLLIGLSMGAGALFSYSYGKGDVSAMRKDIYSSAVLFSILALVMTALCYIFTDEILTLLRIPSSLFEEERQYISVIFSGIGRPGWSIVLTVISLGTRVLLSYALAPRFGETVIWWAIVTGWILADITGLIAIKRIRIKEEQE